MMVFVWITLPISVRCVCKVSTFVHIVSDFDPLSKTFFAESNNLVSPNRKLCYDYKEVIEIILSQNPLTALIVDCVPLALEF